MDFGSFVFPDKIKNMIIEDYDPGIRKNTVSIICIKENIRISFLRNAKTALLSEKNPAI